MALSAPPDRDEQAAVPEPAPPSQVDRRSVLKGIGAAGVTILVAGTGAVSYRAYDNGILDPGSGTPYDAWDHWRDDPGPTGAVAAAILAANPHNAQPWTFHITSAGIDMFSDAGRQLPAVDPLRREHHVGLGCALENLVLGAEARGYRADPALTPTAGDPGHVARVTLTRGSPVASPLYGVIGDRHSNRGPYTSAQVPKADLDALSARVGDLPGVAVRWFTTAAEKAALSALIMDATHAFVADRQQSAEAYSWFRNNRDDIDRHRDGPTLDAQGLDPLTLTLAKLLPATSRTAGDEFWVEQTRTVHTATAAAYGVITVADTDDIAARLTGGRLLQRIHLGATAGDLALQHMNQITERIDRERSQQRPATFAPRFDTLLARPGQHALVAFRVGYPKRAARRSPRRALAAVLR